MTANRFGALLAPLLMLAALLFGACGAEPSDAEVSIVVSTSILGDVVAQVTGADASVQVLMPVGSSPHDFSPSAQQVAAIAAADLVIVNGLGLEEALLDVTDAARSDGVPVIEIAEQLDPRPLAGSDQPDPHVWLDPIRMTTAVELISQELTTLSPGGSWKDRADAYREELVQLDTEIAASIEAIPGDARTIVTNHDSLGYFAERYGLEVVGTVIPGGSTLAAPSAADLAELIEVIRATGTNAIFAETTEPDRLARAVAAEYDRDIEVVTLYTGSLGETGSGADSYLGMMRTNAERIVAALTNESR